jgi:PAS domain S-box-containing protein
MPMPPVVQDHTDDATVLEGILRALDALVIVTDAQGRVTRFNPRAEAITGYTEAEVLGRPVSELVAADQTADVATLVARLAAEGGTIATTQALLARDGRKRLIQWVNTAIVREGRIVSLIGTGTDVTEARRAEGAVAAIEVIGDLLATHGPSPDILHRSLRELADRFDSRYLSI